MTTSYCSCFISPIPLNPHKLIFHASRSQFSRDPDVVEGIGFMDGLKQVFRMFFSFRVREPGRFIDKIEGSLVDRDRIGRRQNAHILYQGSSTGNGAIAIWGNIMDKIEE